MCKRLHLFRLMTELHKFSLKKRCFLLIAIAICIAITWKSEARRALPTEIYSTLTSDTIPVPKKDSLPRRIPGNDKRPSDTTRPLRDSSGLNDSIPAQRVDTFNIRFSKDTL